MKKTALFLALVLILSIPTTAYAAVPDEISPFVLRIYPQISFDGGTATCTVTIIGDKTTDSISLTLKLWQGESCIATWNASGTGYMQFSRSIDVLTGLQYKLTADVTFNGVAKPTVSVQGVC